MWVGVITLFPELVQAFAGVGVVSRGIAAKKLTIETFNPRDFTTDRHRTVDDQPYGGGAGMVMMAEPLSRSLQAAQNAASQAIGRPGDETSCPVILMSPAGVTFNQALALQVAEQMAGQVAEQMAEQKTEQVTQQMPHDTSDGSDAQAHAPAMILVCGRYEGIDQRFIERHVDAQWSVGDYVLSGGELPACVVIDAIARHIPGVLGNSQSIISESHLDGSLEYPQYTRPENALGSEVPKVLTSGDHRRVLEHRRREALGLTYERRPDLLVQRPLSTAERESLAAYLRHSTEEN